MLMMISSTLRQTQKMESSMRMRDLRTRLITNASVPTEMIISSMRIARDICLRVTSGFGHPFYLHDFTARTVDWR